MWIPSPFTPSVLNKDTLAASGGHLELLREHFKLQALASSIMSRAGEEKGAVECVTAPWWRATPRHQAGTTRYLDASRHQEAQREMGKTWAGALPVGAEGRNT